MIFPVLVSLAASVGSAIASSVASIGPALSSFAATIAPTLGNVLTTLKTFAEPIARYANAFLQILDIIKPGEKIEDLGDRALQAARQGTTIDQFDNFSDYLNALRQFDLDPDASAKNSTAEKLVAGLGIATIGVEDKFSAERGSLNAIWLLPLANPAYFTPERMQGWLAAGKLGGDIAAYLEKRLAGGEARSFEKSLEVGSDGKPMNETSLDKLYNALDDAREQWADIVKQMQSDNNS